MVIRWRLAPPRTDMLIRHCIRVPSWPYPPHVQWCGPTRVTDRNLHQPEILPARDVRLAVGAAVGMGIIAVLGARFRHRGVASHSNRRRTTWWASLPGMRRDQFLQLAAVDDPCIGCIIEAYPAPAGGLRPDSSGADVSMVGVVNSPSTRSNRASCRHPNRVYIFQRKAWSLVVQMGQRPTMAPRPCNTSCRCDILARPHAANKACLTSRTRCQSPRES